MHPVTHLQAAIVKKEQAMENELEQLEVVI